MDDDGEETSAELRAAERQFKLNRARKIFGTPKKVATPEIEDTGRSEVGHDRLAQDEEYDKFDNELVLGFVSGWSLRGRN